MTTRAKERSRGQLGKFERVPAFVPHFWEIALNGRADREAKIDGHWLYEFKIKGGDARQFPGCFDPGDCLLLWKDKLGFVHYRVASERLAA